MTGKLWWSLAAVMGLGIAVCFVCGGLSGQSVEIVPQPKSPGVELLSPDFETKNNDAFHTVIVPAGHENPNDPQPTASYRTFPKKAPVIWANTNQPVKRQTPIAPSPVSPPDPPSIAPIPELEPGNVSQIPIPNQPPPTPTPAEYSASQPVSLSPELLPYLGRAEMVDDDPIVPIALPPLPHGFEPWWMKNIAQPLRSHSQPIPVTVEWLTWRALDHSPQVLAIELEPSIRQTEILEEQAAFDWKAFVDSAFNANSDPVGNTLTTGGSPRFRDRIFGHTAGIRRKTTLGGEWEASQRIGYQNNNSRFFVPTQQGTSLLTLSVTQPLMARSGRVYNTSRIAMAHLQTGIAEDELVQNLQNHLVNVTEAYWEMYRARATLQQKLKLLKRAEFVLDRLEARQNVDAQARQVLRAKAAVASRRSEITRAGMSIRNAESRLRFLVNDPALIQAGGRELLPSESPLSIPFDISMGDSLVTAIQNRPEIAKSLKDIRNTSLRVGMAESEYKPTLDLVLGTYVSGLQGQSDIAQSFVNQFNQGEPGWSVGILFEMPLGRRAARAKLNRRQLEMQQALLDFRTSVERTLSDVEISVREVRTTYQEMLSTFQAMNATEVEAQFLYERWRLLVGSERSSTLLLEDLLDAQERVADEEANFVNAQVGYVIALAKLKRAMGVLLTSGNPGPPGTAVAPSYGSRQPESLPLHPQSIPQESPVEVPAPMAPLTPSNPAPPSPNDLPLLPIPDSSGHSPPQLEEPPRPGHSKPKPPPSDGPILLPLPRP